MLSDSDASAFFCVNQQPTVMTSYKSFFNDILIESECLFKIMGFKIVEYIYYQKCWRKIYLERCVQNRKTRETYFIYTVCVCVLFLP